MRRLLEEETPVQGKGADISDQKAGRPSIPDVDRVAIEHKTGQAELFDFEATSHDPSKKEFYARFLLSEWVAEHSKRRPPEPYFIE